MQFGIHFGRLEDENQSKRPCKSATLQHTSALLLCEDRLVVPRGAARSCRILPVPPYTFWLKPFLSRKTYAEAQ